MRILVNGYAYGGNCPPFVHMLKDVNPDVKLTNALGILDDHGVNSDYLTQGDIIGVTLNIFEKAIVYLSKKVRWPIWKEILTQKTKRIVAGYKPDIIINHKASEKAEIMLRTGFRPQLTYIYGGEVHGESILRRELDYIFSESAYILTTTEHMKSYLVAKRSELQAKTRVFPMGYFELARIDAYKKTATRKEIRSKYGFAEDEIILFDNRSLRGIHAGFMVIIQALRELSGRGLSFKMIFLRGFLGTDAMVRRLRDILLREPALARHIVFVDEVVPEERIIDYYFMSDAFVSLLPADQCGKSINDAVFLDCSLILSDLDVYRSRLGAGPCYIQGQNPAQLTAAFESVIKGGIFRIAQDVNDRLLEISQPKMRFENLLRFINKVVAGKKNETSIT